MPYRKPTRTLLAASVVAALYTSSAAANAILVIGTCTLDAAIQSANTDASVSGCVAGSGADTIAIPLGSYPVGELPRITSDIAFVGLGPTPPTIGGDGAHRLFFIGDEASVPTVSFSNLILSGGVAKGGNATNAAGAGAGLGGALFVYGGNVTIDRVSFSGNGATGGSTSGFNSSHSGGGGGGGMFGAGGTAGSYTGGAGGYGGFGGGGGGGGTTYPTEGGGGDGANGGGTYGGAGGIQATPPTDGGFGGGGGGGGAPGTSIPSLPGASGGFGGGGGGGGGSGGTFNVDVPGAGGAGGFGGGGGAAGNATAAAGASGGMGGFGGGGGAFGFSSGAPGLGGFGGGSSVEGGGGGGAGFGGAVFVRSGHVAITNSMFDGNSSSRGAITSGGAGLGKGAALFAVNILDNANGNQQGMPAVLPIVSGCANTFTNSAASDAGTSNSDNADVFGADRTGLTLACGDRIFADAFDQP